MKSLRCISPGQLEYLESAEPHLTKGQAILKIRRIGICGTDLHAFEGTQPFFNYPRTLGHEIAAELVGIDGAPDFKLGEIVTVIPYFNCGLCIACRKGKPNCCQKLLVSGVHIDGGMTEWLSVPSYSLVHSDGIPPDALALIEPLSIGAHAVRRAEIKPGDFVLVVGAGPIGLGTMAFAKLAGGNVIGMDVSEPRLHFCREKLSIKYLLNANSDRVVEELLEITSGDMPAVIIDATGNLQAINAAFKYMAHGGKYILVGLQKNDISFGHPEFHKREGTLMSSRNATREDFKNVMDAIKNGSIDPASWITHRATFDQVKDRFKSWLDPASKVVKAIIDF
jgi:2-desacetyl-2-hydroxyethyl bacteriochlorophyllide A dehydrogenase